MFIRFHIAIWKNLMKYWNELSELEREVIRMDTLESMLTILTKSIDQTEKEDVENFLWQILELVEDMNVSLTEKYANLFDCVRNDAHNYPEKHSGEWPFEYETPENSVESYDTESLIRVVNNWVKSS
jgi:uncharacterized protein YjgD (DUF1641 family)